VQALLNLWALDSVGTILTYLANQSDRLILPKLTSLEVLGVYGSRSRFPTCRGRLLVFSSKVGFPSSPGLLHHPRAEFRRVLVKYRMMVLRLARSAYRYDLVGDVFILHVYRKPYHDAAWMIASSAGLWHTLLYNTILRHLFAAEGALQRLGYLLYCIMRSCCCRWDFAVRVAGAVAAVAVSDLPMYFVNVYASQRRDLGCCARTLHDAVFCSNAGGGIMPPACVCLGLPFPGFAADSRNAMIRESGRRVLALRQVESAVMVQGLELRKFVSSSSGEMLKVGYALGTQPMAAVHFYDFAAAYGIRGRM